MHSPETRTCQSCQGKFTIAPEDFAFYEKISVPPPTWCPQCRSIRRMAFRNERSLYGRPCDLCGKSTISMYSPDKPFKSYCQDCFHSDKWDPMSYGRDYDFSKPFFAQWYELEKAVPRIALLQEKSINSPWINYELEDKNCYLNFGGHQNEDSAYTQYGLKGKNVFDCFWAMAGEHIYETTLSENCYKTFYSTLVYDCRDTYFSFDCRNCSNVIGCTGLRHKQYHIFNQPVSKEEFQQFLKENLGSREKIKALQQKVKEFWASQPQRSVFIDKSVNSTGNLLKECKNCTECWLSEKVEDGKFNIFTLECKDSHDIFSIWKGEGCYDMLAGFKISNVKFSTGNIESLNNEYCTFMRNCRDCFGCVNLHNKQYCILNKQYTKEEYEELAPKIKAQMSEMPYTDKVGRIYKYGEFFPPEVSPYGYNETVANEYFLKTKEEIEAQGFNYSSFESEKKNQVSDYVLPESITETQDDILKVVLADRSTGKVYRLIPMELEFYRRFNLPVPDRAPFERHRERLRFIADHMQLRERICGQCGAAIQSVYTEQEFPTVYCDTCYHSYVA